MLDDLFEDKQMLKIFFLVFIFLALIFAATAWVATAKLDNVAAECNAHWQEQFDSYAKKDANFKAAIQLNFRFQNAS